MIDLTKIGSFLVVGGTRGTGLSFVHRLVESSAKLAVIGRRDAFEVPGDRGSQVSYFPVDLASISTLKQECQRIADTSEPISHIVFFQRFRDASDGWQGEFDVTLTATRILIDCLARHLVSDGERTITIVSSVASRFVFSKQSVGYHVAKAGLNSLARYYAVTLASQGIRVNTVSPATLLKDEARGYYDSHPELYDSKAAATPLGRMGTPSDVSNAVLFLSSAWAGFITGHDLIVDGGLSLIGHEELVSDNAMSRSK